MRTLRIREAVRLVTPMGREVSTQAVFEALERRQVEVVNRNGVVTGKRLKAYIVQCLWEGKQDGLFEGLGNGRYRRIAEAEKAAKKSKKEKLERVQAQVLPPIAQPLLDADPQKIKDLILSILERQNRAQKLAYLKAIWTAAQHEFHAGHIERDRAIFQEFMAAVLNGEDIEGLDGSAPIELEEPEKELLT